MKTATRLTLSALGLACVGGLALWWYADHRRGMAWAIAVVRRRFPDVAHLPPSAVDDWLRDPRRPRPQIVDARSAEEYAVSHLPGSQSMDPQASTAAILAALDPGRPIVLYCSAGYRGAALARRLQTAGRHDVWNLAGGIFAWANADLPLEHRGRETSRVHPYSRFFSWLIKPQKHASTRRPMPPSLSTE